MLNLNMEYHKGILFVRLNGELNRKTSYKLNHYLVPVILKHKIKYVVYNMYELKKIDDIGIKALQNCKCAIKANRGCIYMCEIPDYLETKLNGLNIYETKNELSAIKLLGI